MSQSLWGGWTAQITYRGSQHILGCFETAKQAALCRERAVVYYGEPSKLRNFHQLDVEPASIEVLRREEELRRRQRKASPYLGVHRSGDSVSRPWVGVYGRLSLGMYETEEEAAEAYDRAVLYYDGAGGELNFPKRKRELAPADAETLWAEARQAFKERTTSRFRGVYWSSYHRVWLSRIQHAKRGLSLGRFDSEKAAAKAYDRKARALLGKRARLNFHPKTGEELLGRFAEAPLPKARKRRP